MKASFTILLAIIFGVTGCNIAAPNPEPPALTVVVAGNEDGLSTPTAETSSTGQSLPPEIQIDAGDTGITSVRGSYCWRTRVRGICADTIAPDQLLESNNVLPASVQAGAKIRFSFELTPHADSIIVDEWASNGVQRVPLNPDGTFNVSDETGLHIYVVFARWDQGDASYAFRVLVE